MEKEKLEKIARQVMIHLDEAFFIKEKRENLLSFVALNWAETSYEFTRVLENTQQQGQRVKRRLAVQLHQHQLSRARRCQKIRTETMRLWLVWWLFLVGLVGTWKQVGRRSHRLKSERIRWFDEWTNEWIKQRVGFTHSSLVRNFGIWTSICCSLLVLDTVS